MASYGKGDLTGGPMRASYSSVASSDFGRLSTSISSNIQKIAQNVNKCEALVNRIGTPNDSGNVTSELTKIQQSNNELVKNTATLLKNHKEALSNASYEERRQKGLQRDKLTEEFGSILNRVQQVQRKAADKERDSLKRARAQTGSSNPFSDMDDGYGNSDTLVSFESPDHRKNQMSMQAVMEEEENLSAIREREAAIKSLEKDIVDVNTIFKDLGTMIHEQGELVDSIEANVEQAAVHVEDGNQQLESAVKSQKAARKKKCIIAIILFVVLTVVILVIVIPIAVKNKAKS